MKFSYCVQQLNNHKQHNQTVLRYSIRRLHIVDHLLKYLVKFENFN